MQKYLLERVQIYKRMGSVFFNGAQWVVVGEVIKVLFSQLIVKNFGSSIKSQCK